MRPTASKATHVEGLARALPSLYDTLELVPRHAFGGVDRRLSYFYGLKITIRLRILARVLHAKQSRFFFTRKMLNGPPDGGVWMFYIYILNGVSVTFLHVPLTLQCGTRWPQTLEAQISSRI